MKTVYGYAGESKGEARRLTYERGPGSEARISKFVGEIPEWAGVYNISLTRENGSTLEFSLDELTYAILVHAYGEFNPVDELDDSSESTVPSSD